MATADRNGVLMKAVYGSYTDRGSHQSALYTRRGFNSVPAVLWTEAVINELFSLRRPACEEYETLPGGRAGRIRVVRSATRPVALGIVSGRINFRHRFSAGGRATGPTHPPGPVVGRHSAEPEAVRTRKRCRQDVLDARCPR